MNRRNGIKRSHASRLLPAHATSKPFPDSSRKITIPASSLHKSFVIHPVPRYMVHQSHSSTAPGYFKVFSGKFRTVETCSSVDQTDPGSVFIRPVQMRTSLNLKTFGLIECNMRIYESCIPFIWINSGRTVLGSIGTLNRISTLSPPADVGSVLISRT